MIISWTQWEDGQMIRCGSAEYSKIREWIGENMREAKECVSVVPKAYCALVAREIYAGDKMSEVRFYCGTYYSSESEYRDATDELAKRGDVFYTVYSNKSVDF